MLTLIISWLETHLMPCFFKEQFGISCPGCGTQRAFVLLLKGDIIESVKTYPALIPFLITIIFLMIHLIKKFRNGGKWVMYLFIFTSSIIVVNFIAKMLLGIS